MRNFATFHLGADLGVDLRAGADPLHRGLPVTGLETQLRRHRHRTIRRHRRPQRRVGFLVGLRGDAKTDDAVAVLPVRVERVHRMAEVGLGRREGVVRALVGEELVGPDLLDDLHRLHEQLAVLRLLRIRVRMKLGALVSTDSAPEAGLDPALGEVVEDRDVLGEPDRMPPHRDVRHLADADAGGARRDVGPDENRVRQIAAAERLKVMLADPHCVKAQLLREHYLLAEVLEHLIRCAIRRRQRRENRKAHVGQSPILSAT